MANEIQLIHDDGAETVYAIVRDMAGNWYHGTNAEAFDDANWGDYDIALAEVHACASGNVAVQGTFPAGMPTGFYWLDVYVQAGANPAQTDFRICSCLMYWSGSGGTLVPAGAVSFCNDKAGFKLAADGLDAITTTAPAGVATNFREMLVQLWRRFFHKATKTATQIKTYDDAGTAALTAQTISDDGTTETQGKAAAP